jgi:Arc/MetJ family transcription regulator
VTKRLVEIDDGVLDAAREALGTTTIKDTVTAALEAATALAARRRHLARFKADELPDLRKKKVMEQAWR